MRGWLAMSVALGCAGGGDGPVPTGGAPTPTGGTPAPTGDTAPIPGPDLEVLPAHRYALTQAWSVATLEVRARFDATVSWSGVTTDAWGDPLPPAGVERLVLLEILAPPAELPARLAADDLGPDLISTWEREVAGTAFARLSDLAAGATPFQPVTFLAADPAKSWLLALARREGERLDLLAGVVLVPSDAGLTTQVPLSDGQLGVTWTSAPGPSPLVTAASWETWSIDWTGLGDDALGKPYDPALGDELFLGRYPAGTGAARVAAPLDLRTGADGWWTMDVARDRTALLELARDGQGGTFPGFVSGADWLVGVRCATCLTRFPLWLSVVEVR